MENCEALVDKYRPKTMKQILGQQGDKSSAKKLYTWLLNWHKNQNGTNKLSKPSKIIFHYVNTHTRLYTVIISDCVFPYEVPGQKMMTEHFSKLLCYLGHPVLVKLLLLRLYLMN